jgi:cold shock CspA family protein
MSSDTPQTDRQVGKVKWFNNKAGYGFITVSDEGELSNKDIFVHYSNINVSNSQYKYLVQGEYVEFLLEKMSDGNHEYKAVEVTGIKGGSIMCETRRISRENATENDSDAAASAQAKRPPLPRRRENNDRPRAPRQSSEKPDSGKTNEDGFTTVSKKKVQRTTK